jgi:hypothetical protein
LREYGLSAVLAFCRKWGITTSEQNPSAQMKEIFTKLRNGDLSEADKTAAIESFSDLVDDIRREVKASIGNKSTSLVEPEDPGMDLVEGAGIVIDATKSIEPEWFPVIMYQGKRIHIHMNKKKPIPFAPPLFGQARTQNIGVRSIYLDNLKARNKKDKKIDFSGLTNAERMHILAQTLQGKQIKGAQAQTTLDAFNARGANQEDLRAVLNRQARIRRLGEAARDPIEVAHQDAANLPLYDLYAEEQVAPQPGTVSNERWQEILNHYRIRRERLRERVPAQNDFDPIEDPRLRAQLDEELAALRRSRANPTGARPGEYDYNWDDEIATHIPARRRPPTAGSGLKGGDLSSVLNSVEGALGKIPYGEIAKIAGPLINGISKYWNRAFDPWTKTANGAIKHYGWHSLYWTVEDMFTHKNSPWLAEIFSTEAGKNGAIELAGLFPFSTTKTKPVGKSTINMAAETSHNTPAYDERLGPVKQEYYDRWNQGPAARDKNKYVLVVEGKPFAFSREDLEKIKNHQSKGADEQLLKQFGDIHTGAVGGEIFMKAGSWRANKGGFASRDQKKNIMLHSNGMASTVGGEIRKRNGVWEKKYSGSSSAFDHEKNRPKLEHERSPMETMDLFTKWYPISAAEAAAEQAKPPIDARWGAPQQHGNWSDFGGSMQKTREFRSPDGKSRDFYIQEANPDEPAAPMAIGPQGQQMPYPWYGPGPGLSHSQYSRVCGGQDVVAGSLNHSNFLHALKTKRPILAKHHDNFTALLDKSASVLHPKAYAHVKQALNQLNVMR